MILHTLGLCLLAALAAEPAQSCTVRVELHSYRGAEAEALQKAFQDGKELKLDELETALLQSLEVRIGGDAKLFGRAKTGTRTLEVRGELQAGNEPDMFTLEISVEASNATGISAFQPDGRQTEIRDRTTAKTQIAGRFGKRLILGGVSHRVERGALIVELMTVVVERSAEK